VTETQTSGPGRGPQPGPAFATGNKLPWGVKFLAVLVGAPWVLLASLVLLRMAFVLVTYPLTLLTPSGTVDAGPADGGVSRPHCAIHSTYDEGAEVTVVSKTPFGYRPEFNTVTLLCRNGVWVKKGSSK